MELLLLDQYYWLLMYMYETKNPSILKTKKTCDSEMCPRWKFVCNQSGGLCVDNTPVIYSMSVGQISMIKQILWTILIQHTKDIS